MRSNREEWLSQGKKTVAGRAGALIVHEGEGATVACSRNEGIRVKTASPDLDFGEAKDGVKLQTAIARARQFYDKESAATDSNNN